jgi:hypothetical protein
MSATTATYEAKSAQPVRNVECRIYERYPSDLDTSCQPIAARQDNDLTWPAKIRDISVGGIGLILRRRFERGAGLAIELPDPPSDTRYTVFARVMHTTPAADGSWFLGCSFVNPISQETLQTILGFAQCEQSPATIDAPALVSEPETEDNAFDRTVDGPALPEIDPDSTIEKRFSSLAVTQRVVIKGVRFQGTSADGKVFKRFITKLDLSGPWPLSRGAIVSGRVGKGRQGTSFKMKVESCGFRNEQWILRCRFLDLPASKVMQLLRCVPS